LVNVWKVILATLVIFGAGVVTGGLIVRSSQRAPWRRQFMPPQPPPVIAQPFEAPVRGTNRPPNAPGGLSPLMRKDLLKNLDRELQLTDSQREHIEKTLMEGQDRTKILWASVAPQMRDEWIHVKDQIREELTDDQKAKFDEFMKRPRKQDERKQDERHSTNSPGNLPPKQTGQ
jgi:hypothetical protein